MQLGKVVDAPRRNENLDVFAFWRPIVADRFQFPGMHFLLRYALALCPSSVECERLLSLLNHNNRFDRWNPTIALLEQLLVVARDAEPWLQYNYDAVVALWCKKRRVRCLRSARKDKGSRRKAFEKDESSYNEEEIIP